ncbi:LLM class flavin-dependent oxidoreductase [soil metagenome]
MTRQMNLVAMLYTPVAHNAGGWRNPLDQTNFLDVEFYRSVARTLESGFFDMVFLPDNLAIPDTANGSFDATVRYGGQGSMSLEPMVTLTAMAAVTRHLGLAATLSTTMIPPYHIARVMASIDHLSGGRAAWNIVTSVWESEAQNYGHDALPPRSARYDSADEVLEICEALWRSWEPDALVRDQQAGLFADPDKIHYIDYHGRYHSVRGPLNLPQSPQVRPVLMQAGASDRGRQFAARWAEAVFTLQSDIASMREFRQDMRLRAVAAGRNPDDIRVLPAVQPIIAETATLATERQKYLATLVHLDVAIATASAHIGIDLAAYPMDQPLQDITVDQGARGSFEQLLRAGGARNLTLGEAVQEFSTNELTPQFVGTPTDVADQMQEMFDAEACDGFIITPTSLPGAFEDFARGVTPELQRRGLLRTEYPEGTLRDVMGLGPVPSP